jgi:hypothetical protein
VEQRGRGDQVLYDRIVISSSIINETA